MASTTCVWFGSVSSKPFHASTVFFSPIASPYMICLRRTLSNSITFLHHFIVNDLSQVNHVKLHQFLPSLHYAWSVSGELFQASSVSSIAALCLVLSQVNSFKLYQFPPSLHYAWSVSDEPFQTSSLFSITSL